MSKQWHDEEIEQLLKQMPDVQDTRCKEEVFAKLQAAGAFEKPQQIKQNVVVKKPHAPFYIAAAAVAVLAIVPTFLLNNLPSADDESQSGSVETSTFDMATESLEQEESAAVEMAQNENAATTARGLSTFTLQDRFAVYEEELSTVQVISAVRTDVGDILVPAALLVTSEGATQLSEDMLVQAYGTQIEQMQMSVRAPFTNVQYGLFEEQGIRHYAIAESTFTSAAEAIKQMMNMEAPLVSPVPIGVQYEVEEREHVVTVTFTEAFDFQTIAAVDGMLFVEALNLTANSFGRQLQLKNTVQTEWQGFQFTQPLPKTIGANRVYLH